MSKGKTITTEEIKFPVMESFYTLQGEGAYQGRAAYFIRLGGCDVGCVWCDVKESWEADKWPQRKISSLVNEAASVNANLVVITGGEPLMYDLATLTQKLKEKNIRTHIETSGAHSFSGEWDWVCLSPKKFKAPKAEAYTHADELKIIIYNKSDFAWAEKHAEKVGENCVLLLQPEWSKRKEMTPLIIDYVKRNPQWRVSLQTHKYMQIP